MRSKIAAIIFILFIIYSFIVCLVPQVSAFDIQIIQNLQKFLSGFSPEIPIMAGGLLYYIMTIIPLFIVGFYFFINKKFRKVLQFGAIPFIAYLINTIIKIITQRPRPPLELQLGEHSNSFSYVSRHTFVTACLWGMFIYVVCKYCKNKVLKYLLVLISSVWILFEGFSRVWMGAHNPSDVIGAYILSIVFILIYTRLIEKLNTTN